MSENKIQSLSNENRKIEPPKEFSEKAHVKSEEEYKKIYEESIKDPEGFWAKKAEELREKLDGLGLTRLKHEHMMKIIDFLPKDIEELKTILQAYPLSLPKKDQEAIIGAVKGFI